MALGCGRYILAVAISDFRKQVNRSDHIFTKKRRSYHLWWRPVNPLVAPP